MHYFEGFPAGSSDPDTDLGIRIQGRPKMVPEKKENIRTEGSRGAWTSFLKASEGAHRMS